MHLLFKREQKLDQFSRVNFKLWSQLEFESGELAIVKRYHFDDAVLIQAVQPGLVRRAVIIGIIIFLAVSGFVQNQVDAKLALVAGIVAGGGIGYWYFNEKRETIFVRDLIHGRHFKCRSVVELARKEAWLTTICAFLRQVMESAKHWDGTERHSVEALPKDEARQVIIKGI